MATIAAMSYYTNLVNQFLTVYLVVTLILIILLYKFYNISYNEKYTAIKFNL